MVSQHEPTVSVIVPCYNQAAYLSAAIESVNAQTWKSYEVIVVNDGSKDNTDEVARRYETVHYLEQANQGVSSARNNGLKIARGKYIVFLDSDDVLLPTAFESGIQTLERQPLAAFVSSCCELRTRNGKQLTCSPEVSNPSYEELLRRNYIWHPASVMFRRESLDKIGGFDSQYKVSQDFDIYIRLARVNIITSTAMVNSIYYKTENSLSSNSILLIRDKISIYEREAQYLEGSAGLANAYREGYQYYLNTYGGEAVFTFLHQLINLQLSEEQINNIIHVLLIRHPVWFAKQLIHQFLKSRKRKSGSPVLN
ncbi:MAG: glycosyltransferase [Gloeomargaritaceae cyanobacterium C42_A2020_066]|nr:glycosyltransferase [Gloeomargaritaceae cyanobacterium C42_A2020_066]